MTGPAAASLFFHPTSLPYRRPVTTLLPIFLACSAGDAPGPDPHRADAEDGATDRPSRVLVVEDNFHIRRLFAAMLRGAFDADVVGNVPDALAQARRRSYEALLIDIHLGGHVSGIEVLRDLRGLPGYDAVVAVAVTAYVFPGDVARFLQAGFDAYVSKPFTRDDIIRTLRRSLYGDA